MPFFYSFVSLLLVYLFGVKLRTKHYCGLEKQNFSQFRAITTSNFQLFKHHFPHVFLAKKKKQQQQHKTKSFQFIIRICLLWNAWWCYLFHCLFRSHFTNRTFNQTSRRRKKIPMKFIKFEWIKINLIIIIITIPDGKKNLFRLDSVSDDIVRHVNFVSK